MIAAITFFIQEHTDAAAIHAALLLDLTMSVLVYQAG